MFIDAIHVKIRDGQVTNRPIYVVIGVTVHGERDILGLWAGEGGEGAKYWLAVLTELENRGVADVCIAVCDGLKGLPEAITTVWQQTIVQTCVIHLLRNTFRYAARQYWDQMSRDLKPVYTAPTEAAAKERFGEFAGKWGPRYPAIVRLWENAWSEFVPFLDYDVEIRRVICSTNAIESLNARLSQGCAGAWALPNRASRVEVPVSGDAFTGPDRPRSGTMGIEVEARTERVRDHLRRPDHPDRKLTPTGVRSAVNPTLPARQMLAAALKAEVAAYVAQFADQLDEKGHRLVVGAECDSSAADSSSWNRRAYDGAGRLKRWPVAWSPAVVPAAGAAVYLDGVVNVRGRRCPCRYTVRPLTRRPAMSCDPRS